MTVFDAFRAGWSRTRHAPAVLAGVWMASMAGALPLAALLRAQLAAHLDASLAANAAAAGVNWDWWNEFLAGASGLGQTFVPTIIGGAAVLRNLSGIADGETPGGVVAVVVALSLLVTLFLTGGVVDRLARAHRVGSHGFFAACGGFFLRLGRLAVLAIAFYAVLLVWLHPVLFDRVYDWLIRDVTVERVAFGYRVLMYVVFAAALCAVNMLFDYAKIRLVVEDRRSAIGALGAAARFIRRHPGETTRLYAFNALAFLSIAALYTLFAPGPGGDAWGWVTLLAGQSYIVMRLAARLAFVASQTALFQSRLAHAAYTATPPPAWPDSAAVEGLGG